MSKTDELIKILTELRDCQYFSGRKFRVLIDRATREIEGLYKGLSEDEIVTIIGDELVKYQKDKRFKLNARMSGKNWTLANWLAKALLKRMGR